MNDSGRPTKRPGARERNACCDWDTFICGFEHAFAKLFDKPPTSEQWARAVRDWRNRSTGWEAAQIAKFLLDEAAKDAQRKPLVWLGGRNYAEAGSALAIQFGRPKPQKRKIASDP